MEPDQTQLACIEEYAQKTGRGAADCLFEAIDDWIKVVALTVSQPEKFNVIQFPLQVSVN
jgi:hypothetical protein